MYQWEENVRKVVPYVPGEQPKLEKVIKLNTNENPYPPAPATQKVLQEFRAESLRLYPDPKVSDLIKAIADFYGLAENMVFCGVGSDDVLAMIFMTFFNSEKPILFPDITYSFYDVWADMLRIPYRQIPLREDFTIDPADYAVENGGVVFPNPNAPTGELLSLQAVRAILDANRNSVCVVDEAYIDFGGESALPLLKEYDNLIVVQTFSKSRSMAGSRIGFAIANPLLISYLNDVKYSFNSYTMDALTIRLGCAAISDREYFEIVCNKIVETREWTKKKLALLGFTFGDSKSNFLFVTHPKLDAVRLFEALKEEHIFVRHFSRPERISQYLRITIGTPSQMQHLITFLTVYLMKGDRSDS